MTRKELYNLVWSQAIHKLSTTFGISDVGLAKLCARHNIPTPPRGYWAKKQAGKSVRRESLPNPKDNHEIPLPSKQTTPSSPKVKPQQMIVQASTDFQTAHPLIVKTRERLIQSKPNKEGLLRPLKVASMSKFLQSNWIERFL